MKLCNLVALTLNLFDVVVLILEQGHVLLFVDLSLCFWRLMDSIVCFVFQLEVMQLQGDELLVCTKLEIQADII
jgi:hypothetical protein